MHQFSENIPAYGTDVICKEYYYMHMRLLYRSSNNAHGKQCNSKCSPILPSNEKKTNSLTKPHLNKKKLPNTQQHTKYNPANNSEKKKNPANKRNGKKKVRRSQARLPSLD